MTLRIFGAPEYLLAVGVVAAVLVVNVLFLVVGRRRRDRARVAGDLVLRAAGELLRAEFRPAAPRGWTGYRAPFGALHGSAEGLAYTITINDRRAEDVGHAARVSVEPPVGAFFGVEVSAARLAPVRPGVTVADLFGRRQAQRIPPSAQESLVSIAAVAAEFGVAGRSLVAHSRPAVWRWPDNASPGPLVDFATVVLAAARRLLRSG